MASIYQRLFLFLSILDTKSQIWPTKKMINKYENIRNGERNLSKNGTVPEEILHSDIIQIQVMTAKLKLWNSVEWLSNGTISFEYPSELVIACLEKSYMDLYRERARKKCTKS